MTKKILFSVGEISSDRQCAKLVTELRKVLPDIELYGMGGNEMKKVGVDVRFDVTTMSTVGIKEYYEFYKDLERVRDGMYNLIVSNKPDLIILMDMEGFNIDLAKRIKQFNIPILYYITPQRWMLRLVGNLFIRKLGKYSTKAITVFEEEQKLYEKFGVNASYYGNPIMNSIEVTKNNLEVRKEYNISENKLLIGLLSGSRWQEIRGLTQIFLDSALLISSNFDCEFIIPVANSEYKEYIEQVSQKYINEHSLKLSIVEEKSHNIINACDFVILSSGSATLEAAMLEKPMIIVYKISQVTYLMGKLLYRYKYIGLPNIMAQKSIVPELIQNNAIPTKIYNETSKIVNNKANTEQIKMEFRKIKDKYQKEDTIKNVIKDIIS